MSACQQKKCVVDERATTSPVNIENRAVWATCLIASNIVSANPEGVSQFLLPNGPAGIVTGPVWSAKFLQQMGLVQFASAPGLFKIVSMVHPPIIPNKHTVYSLSTWTSLKWTTWNGLRPLDTNFLGFAGGGFGKLTVNGATGGCWHRPNKEEQNLVAVLPPTVNCRRECARIGPVVFKRPSQTSLSAAFKVFFRGLIKGNKDMTLPSRFCRWLQR